MAERKALHSPTVVWTTAAFRETLRVAQRVTDALADAGLIELASNGHRDALSRGLVKRLECDDWRGRAVADWLLNHEAVAHVCADDDTLESSMSELSQTFEDLLARPAEPARE